MAPAHGLKSRRVAACCGGGGRAGRDEIGAADERHREAASRLARWQRTGSHRIGGEAGGRRVTTDKSLLPSRATAALSAARNAWLQEQTDLGSLTVDVAAPPPGDEEEQEDTAAIPGDGAEI
jgi:hypothetical protein